MPPVLPIVYQKPPIFSHQFQVCQRKCALPHDSFWPLSLTSLSCHAKLETDYFLYAYQGDGSPKALAVNCELTLGSLCLYVHLLHSTKETGSLSPHVDELNLKLVFSIFAPIYPSTVILQSENYIVLHAKCEAYFSMPDRAQSHDGRHQGVALWEHKSGSFKCSPGLRAGTGTEQAWRAGCAGLGLYCCAEHQ